MINKIVVPLDGSALSESALETGAVLAERCGARLHLLFARRPGSIVDDPDEYLRVKASGLSGQAIRTVAHAVMPAQAILECANEPTTLVCMATHGHGGLGRQALGSTAYEVVVHHSGPVLLVGPNFAPGWFAADRSVIVIGTDGSPRSQALIDEVVPLAQALHARVHLVEMVLPEEVQALLGPPVNHRTSLEVLRQQLVDDGVECDVDVIEGFDPAEELADVARREHATCIVVATDRHPLLASLPLAGITMPTVHAAPCPVVVVNVRTPAPLSNAPTQVESVSNGTVG